MKVFEDIENDIQKVANGQFTFILRINNGVIVDYNIIEYVDIKKYQNIKQEIIKEFTLVYNNREGNQRSAVWKNNSKRNAKKPSGRYQSDVNNKRHSQEILI